MFEFLDKKKEEILKRFINDKDSKFLFDKNEIDDVGFLLKEKYIFGDKITLENRSPRYVVFGIEEKGKNYFTEKEKEITKDYNEWEKFLFKMLNKFSYSEDYISFMPTDKEIIFLKKMTKLDYIENFGQTVDGGASFQFTYDGLHYFEERGKNDNNTTNSINIAAFANCNNLHNCTGSVQISDSPIQIGNVNSTQNIEYNFQQAQEALDEIKSKIDELQLPNGKREELQEHIEAAEELIKSKKKAPLKSIMKTIGSIIKDCGVAVVSGLILSKMQGLW